jgi:hypothetical protein
MASTPSGALAPSLDTPAVAGAASASALMNPSALSGISPEALAALEPLKVLDTSKGRPLMLGSDGLHTLLGG